jgi:hypothetical protein
MNALIELKVENERLQQHIRALRTQELSATPSAQHMGSYPSDDMTAQLAANLGFPTRSSLGGEPSRSYYPSIPHGYEVGSFPPITLLEDDGDAEPRRKKVTAQPLRSTLLTGVFRSSRNHSVVIHISVTHVDALTLQSGER